MKQREDNMLVIYKTQIKQIILYGKTLDKKCYTDKTIPRK